MQKSTHENKEALNQQPGEYKRNKLKYSILVKELFVIAELTGKILNDPKKIGNTGIPSTFDLYFSELENLDQKQFENTMAELRKTSKFFPKIPEILEAARKYEPAPPPLKRLEGPVNTLTMDEFNRLPKEFQATLRKLNKKMTGE